MFKTKSKPALVLLFSLIGLLAWANAQAQISPVVVKAVYEMGSWRPLPENKIRAASVDTALSEISRTKQFAFFMSEQPGLKTGTLKITVHLVEEAETATVSILLQQANGISVSSTHSESLKAQLYDGIYKKFQLAGRIAGKKLVEVLESQKDSTQRQAVATQDRDRVNYLEDQIISINQKILSQTGNRIIHSEAKLELILSELTTIRKSYDKLAKKEDIQRQGVAINKVLEEVGQLSKKMDENPVTQINVQQSYVLENPLTGQAKISVAGEAGRNEGDARQLYDDAQELKHNKQYRESVDKLQRALRMSTSPSLNSLILDELNYGLPMFEAQATAITLGGNFQAYVRKGEHKKMLDRITYLYKTALKNNKQNFQRTRAIQAALDQHLNTSQAMSTAMSVQSKMDGYQLHQYMKVEYMMKGKYPDKNEFNTLLKRYNFKFKVLSYKTSENKYSAKLQASAGDIFKLSVDDSGELTVE